MTTEQKARAYDEALERAIEFQKSKDGLCVLTAESIFPELRESDDERARKWLVDLVENLGEPADDDAEKELEEMRPLAPAYLEKQKEQKPAENGVDVIKTSALLAADRLASAEMTGRLKERSEILENPEKYGLQKPTDPSDDELVRHPPIAYTYPSDASRDEQLKMALLALLNSDLIKVAGNKFTKQDLIDWVEKQKEQKPSVNIAHFKSFMLQYLQDAANKKNDSEIEATTNYWMEKLLGLTTLQKEQKPAPISCGHENGTEWNEEDERNRDRAIFYTRFYQRNEGTTKGSEECIDWLKSLRPQPHEEIYQSAKRDLAIKFMNYLDENRPEGKMCLSNGECEDIDKAFRENDWAKILRYIEKYGK